MDIRFWFDIFLIKNSVRPNLCLKMVAINEVEKHFNLIILLCVEHLYK